MNNISNSTLALVANLKRIREEYAVGTTFKIKSPGYSQKPYTVLRHDFDGQNDYLVADHGAGVPANLDFEDIAWYERRGKIKIVGRPEDSLSDSEYSDYENFVAEADERLRNENINWAQGIKLAA